MKNKMLFLYSAISACLIICACNHTQNTSTTNPVGDTIKVQPKDSAALAMEKLNDIAKFVAGLPVDKSSFLFDYTQTPEWNEYAAESKTAWARFDTVDSRYSAFSKSEIKPPYDTIKTLFYPFAGPDFLFANIMFPNVDKMILIGLEAPGTVPQIDSTLKDSLNTVLALYKKSIEDVIQLSFFRTIDMKTELGNSAINGITPIIMLFLARSNKEIMEINPMYLNKKGELKKVSKSKIPRDATAVEILYKDKGDSKIKQVVYLSTNLADPALNSNVPFFNFLKNIDTNVVTFVKSATYLMHKSYFSIIRNTCLKKSAFILQDDSGIGFKFFDKDKWNIKLYGSYTKPIELFEEFFEQDYLDAFKNGKHKPLNFRIGYSPKSNLLIAIKK
jgi:hypothetical protein